MADSVTETPQEKAFFESKGQTEVKQADLLELPLKTPEEAPEEAKPNGEAKKQETVPFGAFHEERERRKKAQLEVQSERENRAKLEGRLSILETLAKGSEKPTIPEWEKDPLNHAKTKLDLVDQKLQQIDQTEAERQRQQNTNQEFQRFVGTVTSRLGEFTREHPDYATAHNFYFGEIAADMKEAGYLPEQIDKYIQDTVLSLSAKAMQDEVNPGERIYNLAKRRGYRPANASAESKLDTIAKGIENSKSLSGASKVAPPRNRLEALAAMNDEEFDEATKGNNWKKLFS